MKDVDYERCVRLYNAGYRPREIMDFTCWTTQHVRTMVRRAIRRGDVKPHTMTRRSCMSTYAFKMGVPLGSIGGLGYELSTEQRKWLVDEVLRVGCGTVQEYLAEVVRDLHADRVLARRPSSGEGDRPDTAATTTQDGASASTGDLLHGSA